MSIIDTSYFKDFREKLGFSNQSGVKSFFSAKDIVPTVDYDYLDLLNKRLEEMVVRLNGVVVKKIALENLEQFCCENIKLVFEKLKNNNIISRLNNQGRRPEEVYFSWMRGFIIAQYFLKSLSKIFEVDIKDIELVGDDDLVNIEAFKRTPKADLQVNLANGKKVRIEVQSGFQGVNDIKQHKILEAQRIKRELDISSMIIHFDLFNGQAAFINTDEIEEDSVNWITRQQMEGQTVFNIDQNYFVWRLIDSPPKYEDL